MVFESSTQGTDANGSALVHVPDYFGSTVPFTLEVSCGPGEQYVAWVFKDVKDGEKITPIDLKLKVLGTATEGDQSLYSHLVAQGDASTKHLRSALSIVHIQAPSGLRLSKAALNRYIAVSDESGWVTTPEVHWQVVVRAIDLQSTISDVDVIDYLPNNGDEESSFTGSGDFLRATVIGDGEQAANTNVRILYTKNTLGAASIEEWMDSTNEALNGASGSTVWCDAASGGNVVLGSGDTTSCPSHPSEVTGLRFQRLGQFGTDESFVVDIFTDATGNLGDDRMVNRVQAHAHGLLVPMFDSAITDFIHQNSPVLGWIRGAVFNDENNDGIWQHATEPVIPGTTVTLTGTSHYDSDGDGELDSVEESLQVGEDGQYFFSVVSGSYTVTFTRPDGMTWTLVNPTGEPETARDNDATPDADGATSSVTIRMGLDSDGNSVQTQFVSNDDAGFRAPDPITPVTPDAPDTPATPTPGTPGTPSIDPALVPSGIPSTPGASRPSAGKKLAYTGASVAGVAATALLPTGAGAVLVTRRKRAR